MNSPSAPSIKSDLRFVIFAVLIGFLLRHDYLTATNYIIDSDEAIVGLMAKHIMEGHELPVFYYGQHYMGSFEAIAAAFGFLIFGVSNVVLKAVPLIFSLALIPLVYIIALSLSGRFAARAAALLMAIPPTGLVIWSSKARGGFMEVIFLGAAALYLMIRWLSAEKPSLRLSFFIAAILGFGWWTNNQIVYFMVPLTIFGLLKLWQEKDRRAPKHMALGVAGFFLGGLPFWIYNLQNKFASFGIFNRAHLRELSGHLHGFFGEALPTLLGAKRFWHDEEVFSGAIISVYLIYGLLFLYLLYSRRRTLLSLLGGRIDTIQPVELLVGIFVFSAAVFICSSFGHLTSEPRYLLPMYVSLFAATGVALAALAERSPGLAAGIFAILLTVNVASSFWGGRVIAGQPFVFKGERVSKDQTELEAWLEEHHYDFIRTDYWIGYRLAFESGEKIRFGQLSPLDTVRIPAYEELASGRDLSDIPVVLVPTQAALLETGLRERGYTFQEQTLSKYTVVTDIRPKQSGLTRLPREDFEVRSDNSPERARFAADGDLQTRWGSGAHQSPGAKFYIDLTTPRVLRGLEYDLSNWAHDYPRALLVEAVQPNGEIKELYRSHGTDELSFVIGQNRDLSLFFDPVEVKGIILTQLGSHPLFDWSIAEISLLQ